MREQMRGPKYLGGGAECGSELVEPKLSGAECGAELVEPKLSPAN